MSTFADLRAYVNGQLERYHAHLADAFGGAPLEGVHQVRVATRRLEEPLELLRPWAKGKVLERLLRRLKRVRRSLADVRELDVLQISLDGAPLDALAPADGEELNRRMGLERAEHLGKARRKCDRGDCEDVERDIQAVLDHVETAVEDCDAVAARLEELIRERAGRVLAEDHHHGAADLHRIRIRLKRLRYAVELQMALNSEPGKARIKPFKQVQGLLGDWNDQLGAARYLSGLARARPTLVERPRLAAGLFAAAELRVRRSQEIADRFLAEWPEFSKIVRQLAGQ